LLEAVLRARTATRLCGLFRENSRLPVAASVIC